MDEIVAEFHYWDYGGYSQTAMESHPEIDLNELESIGREFNVRVEATKSSGAYFTPMRIGWRLPQYGRIIVRVVGEHAEDVRTCIGRIFLRYGRPDEVPSAFFGGRRAGRVIIEDLLREIRGGKR